MRETSQVKNYVSETKNTLRETSQEGSSSFIHKDLLNWFLTSVIKNICTLFIVMLNLDNAFNHCSIKINNEDILYGVSLKS